jgi:seryl-tRNA synthetase
MLDPHLLRNHLDDIVTHLTRRGVSFDHAQVRDLEQQRKTLQIELQALQNQRNRVSKAIGQAKAAGEDISAQRDEMVAFGERLKATEAQLATVQQQLETIAASLPNIPDDSVPDGADDSANREERRWGQPASPDFTQLDHVALATQAGWIDFEAATKITGSRFVVLYGVLARLQRALIHFMLDIHTTEHHYQEVYVPFLVNAASLYGTGQLPKFAADLFQVTDERDLYLIPTAEVPVTNLLRDTILSPTQLPCRWVAHTPCFRSEAGSYGKDTKGLIRQHQFEKVELVQAVRPNEGLATLEHLTHDAEVILQRLELPYRVMTLCAGDLGFSATKTYDLEVWLPGQHCYREISSCSYFGDFQARRLLARWRNPETGKPEWLHTLNGSGLAVGRTLVAIIENHQQADGSVLIPSALRPYLGGLTMLTPQAGRT